ncbi:SCO family protein [Methanobrevibacter sp.]|uniref:SCO family protein n=1 Tax=Methanobrevibacter sp. TaxID=66852 RepID=UPI00388E0E17
MRNFGKIAMIFFLLMIVNACSQQEIPNAKNWKVNDFTFTDQNENNLTKGDLEGKVWIADFIFTNCNTVCLPMTSNMKKLQDKISEEGLEDVQIVSFSVDPEFDNPAVLKKYGESFQADFDNWSFLTGYDQETIESLAKDSFKLLVSKPAEGDQVIHGTSFSLVNQDGIVVQQYSGLEDIPFDDIIKHIKILQSN